MCSINGWKLCHWRKPTVISVIIYQLEHSEDMCYLGESECYCTVFRHVVHLCYCTATQYTFGRWPDELLNLGGSTGMVFSLFTESVFFGNYALPDFPSEHKKGARSQRGAEDIVLTS